MGDESNGKSGKKSERADGGTSSGKTAIVFEKAAKLTVHQAHSLFFYKGFIYVVIGFLLGRAFILSEVLPFALPFFGAMLLIRRDKAFYACLSLLAGALTISPKHSLLILTALAVFTLFSKIGTYIVQDRVKMLPIVVFFSMAAARIGFVYFESGAFTTYDYVMAVVEAGLAFILTLIFLQSLPIFTIKK